MGNRRLTVQNPIPRRRTKNRVIFKLSAREERELREIQAARCKSRQNKPPTYAPRSPTRWDALLERLDAQLVLLDENDRWRGFSVSVREERDHETPRMARKAKRMTAQARKNKAVFERDDFTCRDCYREFDHPEPYLGQPIAGLTRGHIIPDSQGGTAAISNLIAQCQPCNSALGDRVWNPDVLTVPEWDFADFTKDYA